MQVIIRILLKYIPRPILIRLSLIANKIISIFLIGKNVECPVCDKSFSKFLPYGYTKQTSRKSALCPNCLALERHRLLWMFLKDETNFFTDKLKVLHIAPEQCFYKRFKKLDNLDYTTGDLVSPIADIHFDIQDIPFDDNTYDVVICNHVLEHVDDDAKAMREFYRILKPGGYAILQVPQDISLEKTYEDASITDPAEREIHFLQRDHVRLYGLDYAERLKKAGFAVDENLYVKKIDKAIVEKYKLPENEIIYLNKK